MAYHRPTRESFIPKDSRPMADPQSDAVAYIGKTTRGTFYAAMFFAKQAKPVWYYSFKTEERMAKNILESFAGRRASMAYKASNQAARKAWVNTYKVGDVFSTCWGYDQTNVEHYEVQIVHGKMMTVCRIASHSIETEYMSGKCSPAFGQFIGEPFRVLASEGGFSVDGHHASLVKVTNIGGVKVGEASRWSSYA